MMNNQSDGCGYPQIYSLINNTVRRRVAQIPGDLLPQKWLTGSHLHSRAHISRAGEVCDGDKIWSQGVRLSATQRRVIWRRDQIQRRLKLMLSARRTFDRWNRTGGEETYKHIYTNPQRLLMHSREHLINQAEKLNASQGLWSSGGRSIFYSRALRYLI